MLKGNRSSLFVWVSTSIPSILVCKKKEKKDKFIIAILKEKAIILSFFFINNIDL